MPVQCPPSSEPPRAQHYLNAATATFHACPSSAVTTAARLAWSEKSRPVKRERAGSTAAVWGEQMNSTVMLSKSSEKLGLAQKD